MDSLKKGTEISDKELLEAIANQGSELAFNTLYNRYAKYIFKCLHASVADEGVVSDISQNMWLYVWLSAGRLLVYPENVSIKGLLANIATKRIADYYRVSSGQRTVSIEGLSGYFLNEYISDSPESEMYANEISIITQKLLARYPDIDQKCFIYQKHLNYGAAKTAALLGISEASVYKKVSLMSQELRLQLEIAGYYSIAVLLIGDLLL